MTNLSETPKTKTSDLVAGPVECLVMRWIPVSEHMPEYDADVIICDANDGSVFVGSYDADAESWRYYGETLAWRKATHWMPFPDTPDEIAKQNDAPELFPGTMTALNDLGA